MNQKQLAELLMDENVELVSVNAPKISYGRKRKSHKQDTKFPGNAGNSMNKNYHSHSLEERQVKRYGKKWKGKF